MLINVQIQGVSPLLCNRFHEAAQEKASNGSTLTLRGEKGTPREQAEPKLYLSSEGKPVIPAPNLSAAIVEAGKFVKSGKSKLTTVRSSLIPAGLAIVEIEIPIAPAKWEVDSRAVVIPATGGRVMCHRPRFDEWTLKCTLDVDGNFFSERLVRELLDLAGARIGLGDFRPSRKGPFGRFKVSSWKAQ
jgi:hypothetical protein